MIAAPLAGCVETTPETPDTYLTAVERRPTSTAGCIGQTLETCVDSVRRFIPVDSDGSGPDFSRDIQGKIPTSGRASFSSANLSDPKAFGRQLIYSFLPEFGADQRIRSVSVSIQNSTVALARTEAEYAGSGIYRAVAAVAKGECQLSQNEFYKLFDANTRGKTSYHTEFDDTGRNSIGTAKPIAACGLHVQFSSHTMRDVNLISESNPSGFAVSGSLDLK